MWSEIKHTLGKKPSKTTLDILNAVHLILTGKVAKVSELRAFFSGKPLLHALKTCKPEQVSSSLRLRVSTFVSEHLDSFRLEKVQRVHRALVGLREFVVCNTELTKIAAQVKDWDFARVRIDSIGVELEHVRNELGRWKARQRQQQDKAAKENARRGRSWTKLSKDVEPREAFLNALGLSQPMNHSMILIATSPKPLAFEAGACTHTRSPQRRKRPTRIQIPVPLDGRRDSQTQLQTNSQQLTITPTPEEVQFRPSPASTSPPRSARYDSSDSEDDTGRLVGQLIMPEFEGVRTRRVSHGLSKLNYDVAARLKARGNSARKKAKKQLLKNYPEKILTKDIRSLADKNEEFGLERVISELKAKRKHCLAHVNKDQELFIYNLYFSKKMSYRGTY